MTDGDKFKRLLDDANHALTLADEHLTEVVALLDWLYSNLDDITYMLDKDTTVPPRDNTAARAQEDE